MDLFIFGLNGFAFDIVLLFYNMFRFLRIVEMCASMHLDVNVDKDVCMCVCVYDFLYFCSHFRFVFFQSNFWSIFEICFVGRGEMGGEQQLWIVFNSIEETLNRCVIALEVNW